MLSHLWGVRLAVLIAAAASLSACRTFSPDGGMDTVAAVAGTGLEQGRRAGPLGGGCRGGARRG